MQKAEHDRAYRTLDGLRGVAALLVVTRHVGAFFPARMFPESFLAVDLFFLLSGFVIAYAYEARLLAGMSLRAFMKTRLIRLYPLYLLGVGVGIAARLYGGLTDDDHGMDWVSLGQAVAIGLSMLPAAPFLPLGGAALDGPTWTLAPELAANLIYARTVRRLSKPTLMAITALSGAGLVVCEQVYGTLDGGWNLSALPLLAARLGFSFFLGVTVFRFKPERRQRPWLAWACLAVLGVILCLQPAAHWRQLFELVAVMALFPAILLVAVRAEPGRLGAPVFAWLGAVSYAVYVLHHPLGVLADEVQQQFPGAHAPTLVTGALFLAGVTALGTLADRLYDGPVRRRLTEALRAWPAKPARPAPRFRPITARVEQALPAE
jgi:peptidoglycan/LPS O-acetylase OafA/YrhL